MSAIACQLLKTKDTQQRIGIGLRTNCTDLLFMAERSAMPVNIMNDSTLRTKESRITRSVERTSDAAAHLQSRYMA